MLSAWEPRGGRRAVWVTALLFAMLHGSLLGLPAQLLCGLLLALIVRWTDSIYGGMIFHSAYNAAAVLFNYVTSGMESGGTGEVDLFSAIGGVGSVASMLLGALFIGLMIWGLLQKFRVQFALKNGFARMLNGQLPVNPTENPAERVAEMRRALSEAMDSAEGPIDRSPLSAGTILVLAAGVLSALVLYALDIYGMLISGQHRTIRRCSLKRKELILPKGERHERDHPLRGQAKGKVAGGRLRRVSEAPFALWKVRNRRRGRRA